MHGRLPVGEFLAPVHRPTATSGSGSATSTRPTTDPEIIGRNPFLADALLLGEGGKRIDQQGLAELRPQHHRQPDLPDNRAPATRLASTWPASAATPTSTSRGSKAIQFWRQTPQAHAGHPGPVRVRGALPRARVNLPIFERLVLGGEYSIRGYDIRTIGPRDDGHRTWCIGGNKSLLFNGEYVYQIAGPVRIMAFFDAGQVRDDGEKFRSDDFVASTGAEVRFFMPVLNVPFRLIFARNINREGILDNNYQPEKKWRFRFAVGSTF